MEQGPLLVILRIVSLSEVTPLCIPQDRLTSPSILGFLCSSSEPANIWRDEPSNGTCASGDRCQEDLEQVKTVQDQDFSGKGKECPSLGFISGICFSW